MDWNDNVGRKWKEEAWDGRQRVPVIRRLPLSAFRTKGSFSFWAHSAPEGVTAAAASHWLELSVLPSPATILCFRGRRSKPLDL